MTTTLHQLTGAQFALLAPQLVDIYIDAMGYDPAIRQQRISAWRREITWPGFRAVAATATAQGGERVVGLAYGFEGNRERWWDRQLISGLRLAGGPTAQEREMLRSYFEIAEVHVAPPYQGAGIGRALINALLSGTPARWALLSTPEVRGEANAAFGLYRSLGFRDVLRHYLYPGDKRPFAVLGRELPLDASG
ncbi:GNAT family N-acetyltransferase [Corynebacterium liangguodongii]|uniref:GNAT family N-acetyltransferase n=1 Tax=Corynebacterium liangguodongii TaxID=2079535 RepID=A0A2S0WF63_9CORY|nr:GNAT family N-acetyltransferase [Corynebacterium liangguodongii]AWB84364.1 GNAT family N-acetyltransferase [Corynebacterium liangguodongii]PWB99854.1 N-acetyltransferase [Corynebacterium liangguodongii]